MHAWLCFVYNGGMKNHPLLKIYHKEIPEFLKEFAQTEAMLRLRDVGMDCALEYTSFPRFQNIVPYHRYEHSVGVGLITWHFTNDRTMSVAALLHDIATPCFSHVVDFLNNDHMTQESTEADTEMVIRNDRGIMSLLTKYGMSVDEVKDYHRYPIADNDRPKLSADRLEYTLTNMYRYEGCSVKEIQAVYEDITVNPEQNELVFQTLSFAFYFAQKALDTCKIYVADADRYTMEYLARILKRGIDEHVITLRDLALEESAVIEKLKDNAETAALWRRLEQLREMRYPKDGKEPYSYQVDAKKRWMDPFIIGRGRVSENDAEFAQKLKEYLNKDFRYFIRGITDKEQ